jgi:ketosteroid isomerase-like protein
MTFRAVLIGLALGSLFTLTSFKPSIGHEQPTGAEHEVLMIDDRRTDALRRGDPAPLREIYADDYTLVTPAGIVRGKAEQIGELETGALHYRSIEVVERTVRVYDDVAIVLSRDKYDIVLRGDAPGGDLRFTRVYKKFGDSWRLIATHGTRIVQ